MLKKQAWDILRSFNFSGILFLKWQIHVVMKCYLMTYIVQILYQTKQKWKNTKNFLGAIYQWWFKASVTCIFCRAARKNSTQTCTCSLFFHRLLSCLKSLQYSLYVFNPYRKEVMWHVVWADEVAKMVKKVA